MSWEIYRTTFRISHRPPDPNDSHPARLTWSTAINKGTQGPATLPVPTEVRDGQLWQLVLDPAKEPLLGCLLFGLLILLLIPHRHGDGVVQNQGPDEAQDQLQVPIHNGLAVYEVKKWQYWESALPQGDRSLPGGRARVSQHREA